MTPQKAQFVIAPKIYQQFLHTPLPPPKKKIHFPFVKTLTGIEPPKNGPHLRIMLKYQSTPHREIPQHEPRKKCGWVN